MQKTHTLQKPIVTEKSLARIAQSTYSFLVHPDSNKFDVARSVADAFKVTVEKVTMLNRKGKEKRIFKKRHTTTTPTQKIAIVTLKSGDKIDLFSEFDKEAVEAAQKTNETKS